MIMSPENDGYILAFDHGTSGFKTAIVTLHGRIVDHQFEPTAVTNIPGGGSEQDPDDWWRALLTSARTLLGRQSSIAGQIEAICVSSTFSTTVPVDRAGKHLMNAMTWMDSRGAQYIRKVMSGFPLIEGYGLANVLKWISITGGGPSLSGKDDIAHVLYIKNELPRIYEKTYKFLGSKDYLNLRLTGEFAATFDSIMLFWVTDTRDINNIRYSDSLIKKFGADRDKLPDLIRSIDTIGRLKPDIAAELGLKNSVKVIAGSPDHQSALVGSGAVRDFEGHLYIGTSSWIECITPFKKTDMFHNIATLPTALPGKYQCINEQDIAGGALSYLLKNIIYYENRLRKGSPPEDSYRKMDEIAASVPAGSGRLIVTPWFNGERSPVDSKTLRGGLFNVSLTTNTDHIVRAFFEGVAYNTAWNLKYVEKFIGRRMLDISIIGGGAQSDVWCQVFADVLDRNIKKVMQPIHANARGAAFIASCGLGHISFDDIPDLIKYDRVFQPDPANRGIYAELMCEFLNIYKNNRKMYDRLNRDK